MSKYGTLAFYKSSCK